MRHDTKVTLACGRIGYNEQAHRLALKGSPMSMAEAPVTAAPQLAGILLRQRRAFTQAGAPSLAERKADIGKLRSAIKEQAREIASVISADFGNRSMHETLLADVWPVLAAARHTLRHLGSWMKPKRVGVGLELLPGRARVLYQPVGAVGIVSPWNYPFQLAIMPLMAALAAGNRVMLKPSELTPRTSEFMAGLSCQAVPCRKGGDRSGRGGVGCRLRVPAVRPFVFHRLDRRRPPVMQAAAENLTPVTLELAASRHASSAKDARLPAAAESIALRASC